MKIRAGLKLCGRNPMQMPASTAETTAGTDCDGMPTELVSV